LLDCAITNARDLGHLTLEPEHVLLGLIDTCQQHFCKSLPRIGAKLADVRREIEQLHPRDTLSQTVYELLDRFATEPKVMSLLRLIEESEHAKNLAIANANYARAEQSVRDAARLRRDLVALLLRLGGTF
jgi:hypothetical protein